MKVSNRINFSKKKLRTIYCIHYTASLQKQSEFAKLKKINYKDILLSKSIFVRRAMESRIFQISWNFYGSGFRDTEYKTRSLVHDKVTASAAARTRLLFRFVRNPSTAMHFHWPLAAEAFIFPEGENA